MSVPFPSDHDLTHATTAGDLLKMLQPQADRLRSEAMIIEFVARLRDLSAIDHAFRETLVDALCVYLARDESGVESAGQEFLLLMRIVAGLKLGRVDRDLRSWIDRHLKDRPSDAGERRFAMAVWALQQIAEIDSAHFTAWWAERAEQYRKTWAKSHIRPEPVVGTPAPL